MPVRQIPELLNTVRYLKPVQIAYRLRYLARDKLPIISNIASAKASNYSWNRLHFISDFSNSPFIYRKEVEDGKFIFLNQLGNFNQGISWELFEYGPLWLYNLHYFDYLFPGQILPIEIGTSLLQDWIDNNPPITSVAWDPYPISLRAVNWIEYLSSEKSDALPTEKIVASLYQQVLWLEKSLEYHLLGNHLFKNCKALVFAGLFFNGANADRWLNLGLEILNKEINKQILPDGGHFERSPMYHSMILEDCLDLINVLKPHKGARLQNITENLEDAADRMAAFLIGICHPDEQTALFNDAAFGIESPPQYIVDYYKRITGKSVSAPQKPLLGYTDTGYYVMTPSSGNRMLIDCGPIGPDYQPGHSHCDTLSFELSLRGRRVIVDSGCCGYEDGEIRKYNRGNMGHNTITIDKENQSEVWGAHRCARRAKPLYANLARQTNGTLFFKGAHDGYQRLKGRPTHRRTIKWLNNHISIEDRIEGRGWHDIESRLHIHPDLKLEATDRGMHVIERDQLLMTVRAVGEGKVEIENGWYCPEFNKKISCPVITYKQRNASLPLKLEWKLEARQDN